MTDPTYEIDRKTLMEHAVPEFFNGRNFWIMLFRRLNARGWLISNGLLWM